MTLEPVAAYWAAMATFGIIGSAAWFALLTGRSAGQRLGRKLFGQGGDA